MLQHEQASWEEGFSRVAGVDEAGRGPLAGPVVAAAVEFEVDFLIREQQGALAKLNDSKKITAKRRDFFFSLLTHSPHVRYAVAVVEPDEIDRINILQATHVAMNRALQALHPLPDLALIDGRPVPGLPCPSQSIVRGDSASLSIAAASVIAKVTRDQLMIALDERYPMYGFSKHKGYGTKAHLAALQRYGPSPSHRRSFAPVHNINRPG